MAELLDPNPIIPIVPESPVQVDAPIVPNQSPAVIVPKVFRLADQDKGDLGKIRTELMDKVTTWERRFAPFFTAYSIISDSWRIRPNESGVSLSGSKKANPKTLFNSKSGETHRAAETLAGAWFRMLTASDPNFETVKRGLNPDGRVVSEEELFLTTGVLVEQQRASHFKKKLFRSLRSCALFGYSVAEEPFVSLPYGYGAKSIEYTDWLFRPTVRTGFDTSVMDIMDSDYIFFIDFFTKWALRNQASLDAEYWDQAGVEAHLSEYEKGAPSGKSDLYSRVTQSRSRAGYTDTNEEIFELINYHGRLDPNNSVLNAFADSIGLENGPEFVDWSVGLLDGADVAKFHMTQYGSWHTRAKVLSFKDFEDEPIPYGAGGLGRKQQRQMDIMESLTDDKATFDVLNMWKLGKYSGLKADQFVAEPLKTVELEDISQMLPLVGDPGVLGQMIALLGIRREDFRDITGAKSNLQALITKASATEASIAQNEAMRAVSVHAELHAEVLRDHLEISHINNRNYLDEPIWVGLTGKQKPVPVNRYVLPVSVGFLFKVITDKDFRPEEVRNILQTLQIFTSVRNFMPSSINAVPPLVKELFRKFGMNPALLNEPVPEVDRAERRMNRLLTGGRLQDEIEAERAGAEAGQGASGAREPTPGPVPTNPNGNELEMSVL